MHLVGFIRKKFVTMHGHRNVKKTVIQGASLKCVYMLYFYLNQGIINYTVHEDLCTCVHNQLNTYWNQKCWEQKFYVWMKHTVCIRYIFSCTQYSSWGLLNKIEQKCKLYCTTRIQSGARKTGPPSHRPTWAQVSDSVR